jgi:hypothetical protein
MRRVAAWTAAWVLAGALYLLLIDITDLPELIVGAGTAAIAATGFELARERPGGGIATRARWIGRTYRPVLKVPSDVVFVCGAALRQLVAPKQINGVFRAVPFRCDEQQRHETGRHALAESMGSFAPNTIVIGVDADRELILAHQLHRTGGAEAIDVMGLGIE